MKSDDCVIDMYSKMMLNSFIYVEGTCNLTGSAKKTSNAPLYNIELSEVIQSYIDINSWLVILFFKL